MVSQVIPKKKRCTRLWRNNQLLKEENECVTLDVPDIMSNMVVTKFLTHRENEQIVIDNCKDPRMPKLDAEENALVMRSNIHRRLNDKEIFTIKVSFLVEESLFKSMWRYHKWICLEKEMTKGVLTFKEILQLLKEVFVIHKEFIMLSHGCNRKSTSNRCFLTPNIIIS